ncbi:NADH-quinone oxidoreductase subunit J [Desulfomonile tiedjei]|uniref:NADH-quinone oxidoreductase subunit J n=1 Tax=Desulfomonile tiedjei (strain ATCC 49306 / DSM 6799 / DCB-1) TaxID=706587 RepID=I4CCT2_DESTA|nr:NADH:ubiquinone oxidoreductase subunit 6 (chain J) [Desulfomonile tiedjei DSM 6799]
MNIVFYISGLVAIVATVLVITLRNPVHSLLYLILSLLAVALVFFTIGAPFAAALEIIVYAGAIMVLFVFVIMMLNPGSEEEDRYKQLFNPKTWIGPSVLATILLLELAYVFLQNRGIPSAVEEVGPKQVGIALFGPYVLGVELASILLLAGLVGAYHLGRRSPGGGRS